MERRERKARSESLQKLKRLRLEGGNRLASLPSEESAATQEPFIEGECSSDEMAYASDDFIEEDTPARGKGKRSSFFFRPHSNMPVATGVSSAPCTSLNAALEGDVYFKSLMNQFEEELSSSSEEVEKEVEVCNNIHNVSNHAPTDGVAPALKSCEDDFSEMLMDVPMEEDLNKNITGKFLNSDLPLSSEYTPPDDFFDDTTLPRNNPGLRSNLAESFEFEALTEVEMNPIASLNIEIGSDMSIPPPVPTMLGTPSVATTTADDDVVNFYWIDAYEKSNGALFLFGKVATSPGNYVSACVQVNNQRRNLYFLPRETHRDDPEREVTLKDVFDEISQIASQYKIARFGCKRVSRKYPCDALSLTSQAKYPF